MQVQAQAQMQACLLQAGSKARQRGDACLTVKAGFRLAIAGRKSIALVANLNIF